MKIIKNNISYYLLKNSIKYISSLPRKNSVFKYFIFTEYKFFVSDLDLSFEDSEKYIYTSYTLSNKKIFWALPTKDLEKLFSTFEINIATIFPFYVLQKNKNLRDKTFLLEAFSKIYLFFKGIPLFYIYKKYFSFSKLKQNFESDFEIDFPKKYNQYYLKDLKL